MNDGIFYEPGRNRTQRAVVERYGERLVSDWRKTKEAALRNLVVKMAQRLSRPSELNYTDRDEGFFQSKDDLRIIIAEGLEGLANAQLAADKHHAELFFIGGKEHVVMNIDRLYRGAWTLRWVQKREAR